jgi:WD40 repeat protein
VVVTPDGQRAVSASDDQTLKVWDLASAAILTQISADAPLYLVAITPDGRTIIAGDHFGRVHFLRLHGL